MNDVAISHRLEGPVTVANLVDLRGAGEAAIEASEGRAVVDLSGLEASNSLSVALLMAWFRAAERSGKELEFIGAPDELSSIIELSGMNEVLPMVADAGLDS